MRDDDERNPKNPLSVWIVKKRSNPADASEAVPCRKDDERDPHRHVGHVV